MSSAPRRSPRLAAKAAVTEAPAAVRRSPRLAAAEEVHHGAGAGPVLRGVKAPPSGPAGAGAGAEAGAAPSAPRGRNIRRPSDEDTVPKIFREIRNRIRSVSTPTECEDVADILDLITASAVADGIFEDICVTKVFLPEASRLLRLMAKEPCKTLADHHRKWAINNIDLALIL